MAESKGPQPVYIVSKPESPDKSAPVGVYIALFVVALCFCWLLQLLKSIIVWMT